MTSTPEPAVLLRDFVNTFDVETATEDLTSPEVLWRWLHERGLVNPRTPTDESDLEAARTLREGLRWAMVDHHGGAGIPAAGSSSDGAASVEDVCAAFPLRLSLRADVPKLIPASEGVRGGLGAIVAAVAASVADGTWPRLKVCAESTCQWAFLDTSKNRSRNWCSMRVCGNRRKTRSYRARRRTDDGQKERGERSEAH